MIAGFALATAAGLLAFLLLFKPLRQSSAWRATTTPLASIMGSGFLVCAPLLASTVGNYAVLAMGCLLALAFLVGSAIRFNIRYVEPMLESRAGESVPSAAKMHRLHIGHVLAIDNVPKGAIIRGIERISHIVLAVAYVISVSYYLQLLSAFVLREVDLHNEYAAKGVTTAILITIALTGFFFGLKALERIEKYTVSGNLAMIGALLVGLLAYNIQLLASGSWHLPALQPESDKVHTIRVLMGVLIVVQGFETSRFLGHEHTAAERVRTMRWAQGLSAVIYLVFLGLATVLFGTHEPSGQSSVTAIVAMAGVVTVVLPPLIVIAAAGSQFSAAVADNAGCGGLLSGLVKKHLPKHTAYLAIGGLTVGLTWLTDVLVIISLASRAFALFYALQCGIACLTVYQRSDINWRYARMGLFGALGVACSMITVFGLPAGG